MLLLRGQCVQLPLQLPIHTSGQVQRCHHKHFSVRSADACEYNDSIYITTKMVTDSNALRDAGVCLKHNSLALQSTLHWLGPEVCTVCGLQASQIILMVDMILKSPLPPPGPAQCLPASRCVKVMHGNSVLQAPSQLHSPADVHTIVSISLY